MSIIGSATTDVKFHQWPDGVIHQTYIPTKKDDGHIRSLSWSKDGNWIVLVPYTGAAEIISIRDNIKLLQTIEDIYQPTCAVFQNETKKNIALGTMSGQVMIYDVKSRSIKKRYPRCVSSILQIQYNANDTHLAASCSNGEILLFNSTTSQLCSSYKVSKSESVSAINFHRSRRNMLGAGSEEGVVASWDINTNAPLLEIQAHQAPVTSLCYSPLRADMLVTAGLDRRFAFYDLLAKKCILDIEVRSSITALDFSSCGTYLGLGSQAGGIVIYDTRNLNKPISAFQAHDSKRIRHLLFQKVLQPKQNHNNSNFAIDEVVPVIQASASHTSLDSLLMMFDSPKVEPSESPKTIESDSFMAAVGFQNEETEIDNIFMDAVHKWVDTTRKSLASGDNKCITANMETPAPRRVSVVTSVTKEEPTISPIVASSEATLRKANVHQSTPILKSTVLDATKEELKSIIRDAVREEIQDFKTEIREEFAETLFHVRRYLLDIHMSTMKEIVTVQCLLEKMNNVTEDFMNQNN